MWGSVVAVAVIAALIAYLVYTSPIEPNAHIFHDPPPRLKGALQPNKILTKARRLHENRIIGPESFTSDAFGNVYTGSLDGQIWRIWPNHSAEVLIRTGIDHPMCGKSLEMELKCGRPKGMKVDAEGTSLWLVDAYFGLMHLDITHRKLVKVVSREQGVDGIPLRFVNSLDIASDGTIYFTTSSTKWDRKDYRFEVIELDRTARIISYSPKTGRAKTLASNLTLANGVALSLDEKSLLFSEMSLHRIMRLHLKGPNSGAIELVADNMAGYPDNIKRRPGRGSYFVGFTVTRFTAPSILGFEMRPLLDLLAPYPMVKKIMAALTPNWAYSLFVPKQTYFVEIDEEGNIVRSVHDPEGTIIHHMSEAYETPDGRIFIGSHENPYVGILDSKHLD